MKTSLKQRLSRLIVSIFGSNSIERVSMAKRRIMIPLRRARRKVLGSSPERGLHPLHVFSDPRKHVFFGYYDVNPFSSDEALLLATHAPDISRAPDGSQSMKVGYYRLFDSASVFHEIGETTTWCWQQGCRLQWYPCSERRLILYNRMVDGEYGAVVQDTETGEVVQEYDCPLYAVSHDGRNGLSLNYSRLQRLRPGYGYGILPDGSLGNAVPDNEGIWHVDMESGQKRLILSLRTLASIDSLTSMSGAEHYVNHLLFNPSSSRFMLVHLWSNGRKRWSRMLTSNIAGEDVCLLNNEGLSSHYNWISDQELMAYAQHSERGAGFYRYIDRSAKRSHVDFLPREDGHPSFEECSATYIVDYYPDQFHEQSVMIYSAASNRQRVLARLATTSALSGERRCDLHHRRSGSGKYVCVDAARGRLREVMLWDVAADQ